LYAVLVQLTRSPKSPIEGVSSVYIPSLTDGFGDRLLMFDNTDGDPLEMLRLRTALDDTPGFEDALRERVRRLDSLTDPAFSTIRALKRLESDGALVLVSTFAPGKRLSALLTEPRAGTGLHPTFVAWIVTQVIRPLSVLQSEGPQSSHGALTADRIILTDDGRVRIAEHVLASALHHLNRSAGKLWQEFGLLVPRDSSTPHLDARTDVFQVGVLALSMLLARRITPGDVDRGLPVLLDEWSRSTATRARPFADSLRVWVERALQVADRSYSSAAEAHADLSRLPSTSPRPTFTFLHTAGVNQPTPDPLPLPPAAETSDEDPRLRRKDSLPARPAETPQPHAKPADAQPPLAFVPWREPARVPLTQERPEPVPTAHSRWARHAVPIAAAFGTIAVLEAIVIAIMLIRDRPAQAADATSVAPAASVASPPESSPRPAGADPGLGPAGGQQGRDIVPSTRDRRQNTLTATAIVANAVDSPDAAVAAPMPSVSIASGRVSVNAEPWAEVWIDDRNIGETPLAHVEVPAGEHEVVFRHPDFGERRQRVIVRADEVTRASTTFER
jgi:serine/threonine-protein kinase